MKNLISVLPIATEKAFGLSKSNIYVFNAPLSANKREIVSAIEEQFKVKVVSIKTLVQDGKVVRANRGKRHYGGSATRKSTKKAYVTLAKGDSIKVFDQTRLRKLLKNLDQKYLKKLHQQKTLDVKLDYHV
jgi:large subunit ribosomal protein L23